jgi:Tfp pilus assembly protein PilF
MPDSSGNRLDRYLAGELSAREQRDLAQAALDDPELFDTLTAAAVMKATVLRDSHPQHHVAAAERRFLVRPLAWAGIAASVAAAIIVVILYRASSTPALVTTSPAPPLATSTASRAAEPSRIVAPPVILTARLDTLAGRPTSEFRGDEAQSRPPKSHGVVVSVDAGVIVLDVGSLDGISKGSELRIFRGDGDSNVVGRLTIVTVFREQSRGRVSSGGLAQAGDRAEVAPRVQVAALLEQAAAVMMSGDTAAARAITERAVSAAQVSDVPENTRRQAIGQLGILEHRAGARDDAERHLRAAVDAFDVGVAATGLERSGILNELGAVSIERGDYPEAERHLRRAQQYATGTASVHVVNNLAAVAALRRDPVTAESMYRSALTLAGKSPDSESDRRAILKNLEDLKAPR